MWETTKCGTDGFSRRTMPYVASKLLGRLVGLLCTDSNCGSKEWHNANVWNSPLTRVCLGASTASTPIEFHRNKTSQSVLATNTWNRFQAGCIHYNGKPSISAVSILNKIPPTDDNELRLQPGGYARHQASKPVKDWDSYVHLTTRNFEILFNTRLQRRYFNERNNAANLLFP